MISDALQELVDRALAALDAAGCDMQAKGRERWRGKCPLGGHRDLTLQVDLDKERLWLSCAHANCDWRAIQEAVGLGKDDLQPRQTGRELVEKPFDQIPCEPVRFLVPDRVPVGAVTLLAGDPKLGKSTYTALIAAGVTKGVYGEPAVVGLVSVEDTSKSVTGPRLKVARADRAKVVELTVKTDDGEQLLTLPEDVSLIERFVEGKGVRLLILDPLSAFLTERVDTNKDHSIRRALAGLTMMAERRDVAVVVVVHLNKDEQKSLIYRVGGSIGLVGAARSILLFARDPDDPEGVFGDKRLLAHAGSNWAKLAPTQGYRVEEHTFENEQGLTIVTTKLVLEGESDLTAEELVGKRPAPTKSERATEEILSALENGPRPASEIKDEVSDGIGCASSTIERVARDLRARGQLRSSGEGSATTWYAVKQHHHPPPADDGGVWTPVKTPVNMGFSGPSEHHHHPERRDDGVSDDGVENGQPSDRERVEAELQGRKRRT
jgi:hypothetical protein